MLIRIFKSTGFGPILLMVLFAGALWAGFFMKPPVISGTGREIIMPLWSVIVESLSGSPVLGVAFSACMMFLLVIIMVRFNTSVFFIARRTNFPAFIYIILFSVFPGQM